MAGTISIDFLRALEVFLSVADTGSMTSASRLLHITQSAISQYVKLLEIEVSATLIDRHNRPLRLTPAGLTLRQHAVQLLLQADQARADVRNVAAGPTPHLRIAMFATLAKTLGPAIVNAILSKNLSVQHATIMRSMAVSHVGELLRRDVDVIVTSNALYDIENMERHELIHEQFILILPRNVVQRRASLREIALRLPLIRYTARTEAGRLIERHLRRLRLDVPQTYSFDAPEDLFAMIASGYGWAITPPSHVVHALAPKASVELRALPKPGLGRSITLVARKGELGDLPARLATLCRQALTAELVPRVHAIMPGLADHFAVTEDVAAPTPIE